MSNGVIYYRYALTGGADEALDSIDGGVLKAGDVAFVYVADVVYIYYLDPTSGDAEASPGIIAPDTNAGDKRWVNAAGFGGLYLINSFGETFAEYGSDGLVKVQL